MAAVRTARQRATITHALQSRSLPAVREILSRLALDEASLQYVLDIVQGDEDATADAQALYDAIGPFLVRSAH